MKNNFVNFLVVGLITGALLAAAIVTETYSLWFLTGFSTRAWIRSFVILWEDLV